MPPAPSEVEPLTLVDAQAFLRRIGFTPNPRYSEAALDALNVWVYAADPEWLHVKARFSAMGRYVHTIILYVPYRPARYGKRGLCKGYKNPKHEIRFPAPHNWEARAQRWLAGTGAQHILRAKKQQANAISIARAEDRAEAELAAAVARICARTGCRKKAVVPRWSERLEGLPRKIEGLELTLTFTGSPEQIVSEIEAKFSND